MKQKHVLITIKCLDITAFSDIMATIPHIIGADIICIDTISDESDTVLGGLPGLSSKLGFTMTGKPKRSPGRPPKNVKN